MAGDSTSTWSQALRLSSDKSPFDSPVPATHKAFADIKPVSWKRMNIGGILITIYGIDELKEPEQPREVACMWLMHGRGDTQDSMAYTAAGLLEAWNDRRKSGSQRGLICVCFDQRNHGSRMIENKNNISWKQGNPTHGQDMYNTYCGTASDLSLLITQVPMYLPFAITEHLCGGVSLGGHASWVAIMQEPRLRAAMIVVGCPDYVRLMTDRAIRSKVSSTLNTEAPHEKFLGSADFPFSLITSIQQLDPAGSISFKREAYKASSIEQNIEPSWDGARAQGESRLWLPVAGKSIICLSGGKDRLVPYAHSEPFLKSMKAAADASAKDTRLKFEIHDFVDPTAGHEFSAAMRKEATSWLCTYLDREQEHRRPGSKF